MGEAIHVPGKSAVRRAGTILRQTHPGNEEWLWAVDMLSTWRSLHSYPINTFQAYLRTKVKREGYQSLIIAQRLKRMPSIIAKLQRFPQMSLISMQDIGGIRVIMDKIQDVYDLHKSLLEARFRHEAVKPPKDYIATPKNDGYRSLHQVFRYASRTHPELNGLHVELQLRTRLQHSWATAVETLGLLEKSSLKSGEGSEETKRFFRLASVLFALDEKQPVLEAYQGRERKSVVQELLELEKSLRIARKLEGVALTAKKIERNATNPKGYHLMTLDTEKNRISIIPFSNSQLDDAEELYKSKEQATRGNPSISVVLISAGDIGSSKKAYPNYLLDTKKFISHLMRLIKE